jgi:hypothetical protein
MQHIRVVPNSKLDPETGRPDSVPHKYRENTFNYVTTASFHIVSKSLFLNLSSDATGQKNELLTALLNKLQTDTQFLFLLLPILAS